MHASIESQHREWGKVQICAATLVYSSQRACDVMYIVRLVLVGIRIELAEDYFARSKLSSLVSSFVSMCSVTAVRESQDVQ